MGKGGLVAIVPVVGAAIVTAAGPVSIIVVVELVGVVVAVGLVVFAEERRGKCHDGMGFEG